MLFPWALLISFLLATGPMLVRWSALGLVMIESQITALFVALVVLALSGHSAVTYTKTCFVFQVKSELRSASRLNLMMAYSSFLVE
jgi:hypothetical protein